jgi:hypothetical protein
MAKQQAPFIFYPDFKNSTNPPAPRRRYDRAGFTLTLIPSNPLEKVLLHDSCGPLRHEGDRHPPLAKVRKQRFSTYSR